MVGAALFVTRIVTNGAQSPQYLPLVLTGEDHSTDPARRSRHKLHETHERIGARHSGNAQLSSRPCTRFTAEREADQPRARRSIGESVWNALSPSRSSARRRCCARRKEKLGGNQQRMNGIDGECGLSRTRFSWREQRLCYSLAPAACCSTPAARNRERRAKCAAAKECCSVCGHPDAKEARTGTFWCLRSSLNYPSLFAPIRAHPGRPGVAKPGVSSGESCEMVQLPKP